MREIKGILNSEVGVNKAGLEFSSPTEEILKNYFIKSTLLKNHVHFFGVCVPPLKPDYHNR